jgi:hypothetical protein
MSSFGCNKRTVFDFKRADWNGLQNKLRFSNLSPTDHSNLDLNADWEKIKHLINKKDFCRKRAKQSLNPSAWEKFRTLRRQVKSLLHDKRKEFFQNLPDLLKTSSKKFWSVFKSVSKHSNTPNKVSWSKDPTTHIAADNPADIANVFNRYFFLDLFHFYHLYPST